MSFFEKVGKWITGGGETTDATEEVKDTETCSAEVIEEAVEEVKVEKKSEEVADESLEQEQKVAKKKETATSNSIQNEQNLKDNISKILSNNYRGGNVDFSQRKMLLWIDDSLFYDALQGGSFVEDLKNHLWTDLGYHFNSVLLNKGKNSNGALTQVQENVYIEILDGIVKEVAEGVLLSAEIHEVPGAGNLLDAVVNLEASELEQIPNKRYNIGAGRNPQTSGYVPRVNHIAIDVSPTASDIEKNKYVSRTHAYITHHPEYGFLLHVETGGSRAAGKRTHIQRGDEIIEVDNPLAPHPLRHDDYIVLTKKVVLHFKKK